jgi:3-deoxy-manno-octulosonate cytidylyltransferase (CMP-KDO synthetase)
MGKNEEIICVIPARFESTRLPGKPLAELGGKPMIQWVAERASRAKLIGRVLVATDDDRIYRCVRGFGFEAVMTSASLPSGTDRVACAVENFPVEIVINVQGDEPFIEPDEIDTLATLMIQNQDAEMGTLVRKAELKDGFLDTHSVKVVIDRDWNALYFSRSPIPYFRDVSAAGEKRYFKHVGIYAYRKKFLIQYVKWRPSVLEEAEKLEQLRALENGIRIKVAETPYRHICIDTPADLKRANAYLASGAVV